MVRGASWKFSRAEHSKRYWASMGWNGLLGGLFLVLGTQLFLDAPIQALRDRCHDWKNTWSATEELAACNLLLAEHSDDDRSGVIAARGSAYYRLGDYRRAGADYAAAIDLDPQDGSSHYNLGLVHERLGNREHAVADYGAAIRIDPKNAEAFANRGGISLNSGKFDQAIADFNHSHDLQPTNVTALANRGLAYAWKSDPVHAEQDFAAVRKSDPSNLIVLHGEAVLAINRGDMKSGVRFLSNAIARDPNDAWAFATRAEAYRNLGEQEKMRADAAAALRLRSAARSAD